MFGQSGHGVRSSGRRAGGSGTISSWTIERGALADRLPDAVGAGVAAADHDDVLARRADRARRRRRDRPARADSSAAQRLRA